MFRVRLIILILHLGFIFQACTALEYFDGSSKEEIKKFKMTKNGVWNELDKLKLENANLQRQMNILRKENQEIRDENENKIARIRDKAKLLNSQMNKLRGENQRITEENRLLSASLTSLTW